MTDILFYGHPDSGHACKVAAALALSGLAHKTQRIDMWADRTTRPAAFLAASPLGEVPAVMIDRVAYTQSGAILLEIARRFRCLGGETPEGLARANQLLMWEANRIGMCLPQLCEARRPGSGGLPADVVAWLEMRYRVDQVNFAVLLDNQPFFHGETPGIGDCAIWGYMQWLDKAGVAATPDMAAWLDRMRSLDGVKAPADYFSH